MKNDRARQEQLAKERLERLRNKRASRQESSNVDPSKSDDAQEVLIKYVDDRQTQEQMVRMISTRVFHWLLDLR